MINRKFVNPGSISKYLKCQLCMEVYCKPTRLPCGHIYCSECITKWIKKNPTCPVCRRLTLCSEFQKDLLADNLIGELQVYCSNKKSLCKWQGPLEQYYAHEKRCLAVDTQKLLKDAEQQEEEDEEIQAAYNKYDPGDLMARLNQKVGNNQEFRMLMGTEKEATALSDDPFSFLDEVEAVRRTETILLDSLPKQKRDRNEAINNINQ